MNPQLYGLSSAAWFSACGLPFEPSDIADARAYLDALGLPARMPVEPVASWEHAERIIRNPAWDVSWWEREEAERRALMRRCVEKLGEAAALESLSLAAGAEHEAIHGAAAVAAARAGVADEALVRAAAGAASMAANGLSLTRLAETGPEHLFVRKYALFEGGRWPLGIIAGVLHLF